MKLLIRYSKCTLLVFLFSTLLLFSQKEPLKFGKVPSEDLQMSSYPKDTSASAVILVDYGLMEVADPSWGEGFGYKFTHQRRIKIFDRKAFSLGDIAIFYRHANDYHVIKDVKAHVVTPDGEKVKVKKKNIFTEKVDEEISKISFSIPNLTKGSVIEYQYELYSENYFFLRPWYFQQSLPVRYSEFRIKNPSFFTYAMIFAGLKGMETKKVSEDVTEIRLNDMVFTLSPNIYTMKNGPAMKEEAFITTMDDYRANVRFQLSEYTIPGKGVEKVLTTWEDAAKDYEKYYLVPHAEAADELMTVLKPFLETATSERDKAKVVFNYLVKNYKWNGAYSIDSALKPNDFLTNKEGNSAYANMAFLTVLRTLGIKADPILCSTRAHGKVLPNYPIINQFNHLFVIANLDGSDIFIDIAQEALPMGFVRSEANNKMAWLAKIDNPIWIDMIPSMSTEIIGTDIKIHEEGGLEAKMVFRFMGYDAVMERNYSTSDTSGNFWAERAGWQVEDFQLSEVKENGLDQSDRPFVTKMKINTTEAAIQVDDFIYLSPMLYTYFGDNPFKVQERKFPVDFPYPFRQKLITKIEIPTSYIVEELPEKAQVKLSEDAGNFTYNIAQQGNHIQITCDIQVNQVVYYPEQYPAIKQMFDQIAEKLGEQIVLKKDN